MPPEPPQTRYARGEEGYVAFQVFGTGPGTSIFMTNWLQNLDVMWDEPTIARYLGRLSSFSRVLCFDKRGSGVSDPVPLTAVPSVEQWMDEARLVMDAAAIERADVIGDTEGGPMAMLFAATYPDRVSSLTLVNTFARWSRSLDYPIGMPRATVDRLVDRYEQHWGVTPEILALTAPSVAHDERFRRWFTRYQRLAMPRGAATALYRWVVSSVDVRAALPTIRVPTLVIHRSSSPHYRIEFGRYLADSIPGARLVEVPGADAFPFHAADPTPILDEIEEFITGSRPEPSLDRRLATILVTDIVGSTDIAARAGDAAWIDLLARHDAIVREHVERYRGREMNNTGDGFLAMFDGPTRAVSCGFHLERALAQVGIEVRVGLHTGEVELVGSQVSGLAVHIAARVMGTAPDGGVMASATVRDLVMGSGIEFAGRGAHRLKGVPGEWQIHEVVSAP